MICLAGQDAHSQNKIRFYTTTEGLPSNQIYNVYRDSRGYLWMGHALGLSRFDGNRFTNYFTTDQNSLGFSNIFEDRQGVLWCHNFGGQIFYVKNNVLRLFEKYDWKIQTSFPGIIITANNELVATHENGLYIYSIDKDEDTLINAGNLNFKFLSIGLINMNGTAFCLKGYKPYILENRKLIAVEPLGKETFETLNSPILLGSFKDSIYSLSADRKIISVLLVNNKRYKFVRKFLAPENAFFVSNIDENEAWICAKNNSFSIVNPNEIIEDYSVTSVVKDKEGNRWIGTLQNGLGNMLNEKAKEENIALNTVNTEIINALSIWKEQLVAVTNKGQIFMVKPKGQGVKNFHEPIKDPIGVVHITNDSTLLFGSNQLFSFKTEKKPLNIMSDHPAIKDIASDEHGNLYIANAYSLNLVRKNGSIQTLRAKRCFTVEYSSVTQTAYSAFSDGTFAFKNGKQTELKADGKSIFSPSIAAYQDEVVIGTVSNGMYLFKNDSLIYHINTSNGLLSNHILKIKYFSEKAWILTDISIDEWDTKNNSIIHHTFGDDIALSNITDFVFWEGRLIVAYGKNLRILPLTTEKVQELPEVFFDHVIVNEKDTITQPNPILNYASNNIRFVVSGISFNNGKHLRFQYRLAGADNKWISVPAAQYLLKFPLLQPGKFTLQLRAISANGIKGPIRKYTFTILKPWWQTGWFIGGSLLISALGIYLFISTRIVSIRLKNALLLEKLSLQSQWRESTLTAIRSQMNPHFIFNALNTIQSYIYANDENKASNYLGKFSDLIRRILDYSQKEQITLSREIEMLQLYIDLEVIRFENTMKANIYVDENLNTDNISLPPMLVQPYIENALKHGLLHKMDNRELFIRFETDSAENHLLVTIDDNGIGRVASEEINQQKRKNYASFATVANQKRLDILNLTLDKKITIETIDKKDKYQRPIGTLVILKIPLSTQS